MPDRVQALLGEIEDHLQHLLAADDPAERRERVAAVGDALHGLAELMSRRRWPRVVRDGLPGGATFIRLTEEESAALLADIQDAYGELQDRLAVVEAQLLSCRKHLHAATAVDDDKVLAAALLRRGADLTSQQQAAVTTLLAAAGPDPASAANRSRPLRVSEEQTRRRAQRARLLATGWLSLTELTARREEADVAAVGAWVYEQLRDRALIVLEAPDGTIAVPAFQVTADGQPRPELRPLLEVLLGPGLGGWAAWTWLTSPSSFLSGEVPEQVAATDPARALRAATAFVTAADD